MSAVEIARRALEDGVSVVSLEMKDGSLELCEHDVGGTPTSVFGSDIEYFLNVAGGPPLKALLATPGREVGRTVPEPLDVAGLEALRAAMVEAFGNDLDLVRRFREWLDAEGIPFTTALR